MNSRLEIKEAVKYVRGITQQKKLQHDEWYRLDRLDASRYLEPFPKWRKKIVTYFDVLKEQGHRVVYVDVCGRASGEFLGVERSYNFSFQPAGAHLMLRGDVRVEGDIFSRKDFNAFISTLRANGDRPAFVTFEPVAGLEAYTPCKMFKDRPRLHFEVTYQLLIRNLENMVGVLRGGGFILLRRPFAIDGAADFLKGVPQEEYTSSRHLRAICNMLKCSIAIEPTIFGPAWLIRKMSRK